MEKESLRNRWSKRSKRQKIILGLILIFGIPLLISAATDIFFAYPPNPIPISSEIRQIENLDRGLIVLANTSDHSQDVYLSWRLLISDPVNITFDVFRENLSDSGSVPKQLNTSPISITTDFIDSDKVNKSSCVYYVVPRMNQNTYAPSKKVGIQNLCNNSYISIPLKGNYNFARIGVGDLDGDGSYDYVIKQPSLSLDPAPEEWIASPCTYKIEAYASNGSFLWSNDLGWDIEQGIWYSPFIIFDLDGDNRSEVIVKTGTGDHRNAEGKVTTGDEKITVWEGLTGNEICSRDWIPRWFQDYTYNSRNFLGIAFLDGIHPSVIMQRGTYDIIKLVAMRLIDDKLVDQWSWASSNEFGFDYWGQSSHFFHSADIDNDRKDEIILGACAIDDNGEGLWSTRFRHPDQCYVGDLDPNHAGLEIYYGIEGVRQFLWENGYGISMVDAKTGNVLWKVNELTQHIHREGLVADFDKNYPGTECVSGERDYPSRWLHTANGTLIARENSFDYGLNPTAVYWNADLQREIIFNGQILDYDDNITYSTTIDGGCSFWADILGDWREELVVSKSGEIRIYSTMIPAQDRRVSLMYDPIYRADITHLANGYPQVPTTSYCLQYTAADKVPNDSPPIDLFLSLYTFIFNFISIASVHIYETIAVGIVICAWLIWIVAKRVQKKRLSNQ
jgi:rhamnogalacturonan endolyase